jgi:hypothetical protein
VHDDERAALAGLCAQLPTLRAEIAKHPAATRQLLARIEAEARAGRPIMGLLAELLGTDHGGVSRQMVALPGLGPGRSSEERFGCPDGACDREEKTTPAGPLPRCWLTGRFMARRSG